MLDINFFYDKTHVDLTPSPSPPHSGPFAIGTSMWRERGALLLGNFERLFSDDKVTCELQIIKSAFSPPLSPCGETT